MLFYWLLALYIYPSLLSIMRRAAWGGGKPGHVLAFPGYACETTYIPTDFFQYKYFDILSLAGLEPVRKRNVAQQ